MPKLVLVAALAAALVAVAGADGRAGTFKPRKCGEITVRKNGSDYNYSVKVFQAPLACATAQATISRFILSGVVPRKWICRYGHSRDAWAATCARIAKNGPIVRVYLIAG